MLFKNYKMVHAYSVLVVCVLISFSVAAPTEDAQAKIISYENENDGLGNYEFSFETSNGILRSESGRLVNVGEPNEHIEVQGSYSYTDPEGNLVVVRYTADDDGYHIDQTPPITVVSAPLPAAAVASLLG